jgi:hypothetical protein
MGIVGLVLLVLGFLLSLVALCHIIATLGAVASVLCISAIVVGVLMCIIGAAAIAES